MEDKIQHARRAAFEEWDTKTFGSADADHSINDDDGSYSDGIVDQCWRAFNAALDCVVIELPQLIGLNESFQGTPISEMRAQNHYNQAVSKCRAAIESTNLGIKVK